MKLKILKLHNLWALMFFISLFYIKELNYLYFDSTQSADFGKYFSYFEYFFGLKDSSLREQGTFYYYLHSLNFTRYSINLNSENFYYLLNKSIQEINFIFYIVGAFGYYRLLSYFKFNKTQIYATLTVLNFLPIAIAMIITFKPEILAFSLLPWVLLCVEKFKKNFNIAYLFLAIPLLALMISIKGSVLSMVGLYLFITNISIFNKLKFKESLVLIIMFISVFLAISIQDYQANQTTILQVEHEEKYNNKAPIKILYDFDFVKTIKSPIKYNHSSSFISLTLLDTFGDYFDIYWNLDSSLYAKNRKDVLVVVESGNLAFPKINFLNKTITVNSQSLTDIYTTYSMGLFLSLIFYLQIVRNIFFRSKYSKYILAPIIGMSIVLIQSVVGFPIQNWDPNVGDSIKPFYYGFFITLSFIFVVVCFLKKNSISYLLIPFFILSSLHILGFPKEENTDLINEISIVNSYSDQCKINIFLFDDLKDFKNSSCKTLTTSYRETYKDYRNFKSQPKFKIVNFIILIYLITLFILIIFKNWFIKIKNKK